MPYSAATRPTRTTAPISTLTARAGDTRQFDSLMRRGTRPGVEDPDRDLHLNQLIPKPWGYEYRVYADQLFDLWQLCLRPGLRTSMHAHPRKTTYLLCLGGNGRISGLSTSVDITSGDLAKIDRGAFHRTTNTSASRDLHLIEVETPRNKLDLIRLQDDYDRAGRSYETKSVDMRTALRRVPYIPDGHMCRTSPDGRFGYAVTSGMDIHYRGITQGEFHVPIGIGAFLAPELEILSSVDDTAHSPLDYDTYYLSITHNL